MLSLAPEPVDRAVLEAARAPFAAFGERTGAGWTDAPTLQPLSLLLDLAGEAMRARLFVVTGEGGEELALRPDFTVSLARAFAASGETEGRWLYEGPAFRSQPRGSDRPSEFLQLGVELFGAAADPAAEDAQIAALAWTASAAGGRRDLSLLFGDVALFGGFLRALALPEAAQGRLHRAFAGGRSVRAELDRLADGRAAQREGDGRLAALLTDLPEAEAASALEEVWRLAGIQPVGGRGTAEIVHRLVERAEAERAPRVSAAERDLIGRFLAIRAAPAEALDHAQALAREAGGGLDPLNEAWRRRLNGLAEGGVPADAVTLDCGLARPFGYYDGMLFEVRSAALGNAAVAAGGRSDGLVARLGGAATPSVGCMVRPGRAAAQGANGRGGA